MIEDTQQFCWMHYLAKNAMPLLTLLAVIVALFKEKILSWLWCPKLKVRIDPKSSDCHKTKWEGRWPMYWFMLWVDNDRGWSRAEKVQVYAAKLTRQEADGQFNQVKWFIPMNLKWSHTGGDIFLDGISPKMGHHCDLGSIVHPSFPERPEFVPASKVWFELATQIKPYAESNLLNPGTYRLLLEIAAANAEPITSTVELTITGEWFDQDSEMFFKGISLRVL
jgi:hypothetical protein